MTRKMIIEICNVDPEMEMREVEIDLEKGELVGCYPTYYFKSFDEEDEEDEEDD